MEFNFIYPEISFCTIINDVNLKFISNNDFAKLKEAVETFGVVVIKEQSFNDSEQVIFSKKFGKLEKPLEQDISEDGNPAVTVLSNVDKDKKLLPKYSDKVIYDGGNKSWHSDSSFKKNPATFSILSAREIPKSGGGNTEFADCCYALETWDTKNKKYLIDQLKNLICEHSIVYSRMMNTGDIFNEEYKKKMLPVRQRLIRTIPINKRSAFFVGSHCSRILGWELNKGRELIKGIIDWIVSGPIYRHNWSAGDIVIWDNRKVLHRGTPFDKTKEKRIMHRTTVAGNKPSYEEKVILH
jgi:alpha-ketoglutarate-dependent 2,4-dichlorophenoxyacetate dioxygenase